MTRTPVRKAISTAYRMINFVQDDIVNGKENALELLNRTLATLNLDPSKVGYKSELNFNLIPGKYIYTVALTGADISSRPLVSLEYAEYERNSRFINIPIITAKQFYGTSRLITRTGQPYNILFERQSSSSILKFLPTPDSAYPIKLQTHLSLTPVDINDDLDMVVPASFDQFIVYSLARDLSGELPGSQWTPKNEKRYEELYLSVSTASPVDTSIQGDPRLTDYYDSPLLMGI